MSKEMSRKEKIEERNSRRTSKRNPKAAQKAGEKNAADAKPTGGKGTEGKAVLAQPGKGGAASVAARFCQGFLATLLLLAVLVVGAVAILLKGPSAEAKRLFTLSCNETSAMKWVPGLFLSDEECEEILHPTTTASVLFSTLPAGDGTDGSGASNKDGSADDQYPEGGLLDGADTADRLDDIDVVDIVGGTYRGKLMLIHDPSRVQIASLDSFGGAGMKMTAFLSHYDAIAGTNAGGFEDTNGQGKGGTPDGIVIKNGQITYGSASTKYIGVVGFDADHVLHVGDMTGQEALDLGLVSATDFALGPVLIKDGVRQVGNVSGINPRTCIGQRADGTVMLLVVEGRLADSLGATYEDLCDIMEEYGAVNACNLDGGSSSGLYFEGERLTRSSSVVGERPVPTAVLVSR